MNYWLLINIYLVTKLLSIYYQLLIINLLMYEL
jgi:hypothetical protein